MKTQAIKQWASPTKIKKLKVFLGFCNHYGCTVHHFADIAAPLYALLYEEATLHWNETEETAMRSLCTALCNHPILTLPDFTKPFRIKSDASESAVGGVLTQKSCIYSQTYCLSKQNTNQL